MVAPSEESGAALLSEVSALDELSSMPDVMPLVGLLVTGAGPVFEETGPVVTAVVGPGATTGGLTGGGLTGGGVVAGVTCVGAGVTEVTEDVPCGTLGPGSSLEEQAANRPATEAIRTKLVWIVTTG